MPQRNIIKIFDELKEQVSQYGDLWREYKARKIQAGDQKQSVGPAPPEPDIEKFAKDHGLVAGRTGLMAEWDLKDTEIGQSIVGRGAYLWRYAFQSVPYRSEISQDLKDGKGSLFMFWKTDDEKEQVPKFKDVRAEVLRAWKLIRARDLALEAAKKLAAEAQKAKKPLKQVFADRPERHVILPAKFTWLNFGNVAMGWRQPARLSTVEGVPMPGWDFMAQGVQPGAGSGGRGLQRPQDHRLRCPPQRVHPELRNPADRVRDRALRHVRNGLPKRLR